MKKSRVIFAIFIIASALYSCSKKNSFTPVSITGKWYYQQVVDTIYSNGVITGAYNNTNYTNLDYLLFNSDATGNISKSDTSNGSDNGNTFGYTHSGNKLMIDEYEPNATSIKDTLTIVSLTQSQLIWKVTNIDGYPGNINTIVEWDYFSRTAK